MGRRERMAEFLARGGAKPPRQPRAPASNKLPKVPVEARRGGRPRNKQKEDFMERAIGEARALLAEAMETRGPVLIYPRHLGILVAMAAYNFPAENSPSDMAAPGGLPPLSAHDDPLNPIPKGET